MSHLFHLKTECDETCYPFRKLMTDVSERKKQIRRGGGGRRRNECRVHALYEDPPGLSINVTIRTVRPGEAEDKMTQERDLGSVF